MNVHTKMIIPALMALTLSCAEVKKEEIKVTEESAHINSSVADTVNNPSIVTAQSGVLRLTAENGKPFGPEIKYMPEWKAFGWFTAKDSVVWEVEVPEAGQYNVQLEWSVSDEDAGKEFILIASTDNLTGRIDKSGSWETFKTKDVGTIELINGMQKIIFRSETKFDKGAILDLREIQLRKP